jgi:peroxiredoxin
VTEADRAATRDPRVLPTDLPVPVDDGACDHLPGRAVPSIALPSTSGRTVDLAAESRDRPVVVYAYPRTGRPGEEALGGQEAWDAIPGARGCTPQNLGYRAALPELTSLGATVYGLSTQDTAYQREMAERVGLEHEVLSDADFALTEALGLPTFDVEGRRLLKRVTLFLSDGAIEHVVYPVFPPDEDAARAVEWLRGRST